MDTNKYILALDQGTTSSRAILFTQQSEIVAVAQQEFTQIFPQPGWVEHDATEIWQTQKKVMDDVLAKAGIGASEIACIGITNQRETTVVWDRATGEPIHNAIVWQDNRTGKYCEELEAAGHADSVRNKTGLVISPYFSGTKIRHILAAIPGASERAAKGELAFGTVDSWLMYKLSGGAIHATDVTNASRTMLYNIHDLAWDDELLELIGIPKSMLPEVQPSAHMYGTTDSSVMGYELPITGVAGDQQAALFGQQCVEPGMLKNTYGTGCFLVVNTGSEAVTSEHQLLTTIGWQIGDEVTYALEGSVFVGGSVIQWLRDGLQIIDQAQDSEQLAGSIATNEGVYLVPAFTGLGAPHWDPNASGTLIGITRGTTRAHIARAALESICYQTKDVVEAMAADLGRPIKELRVDGGAVGNNLLMQFQSDILDTTVVVPKVMETTALGAAYLAGLGAGVWQSVDELSGQWQEAKSYQPDMEEGDRTDYYQKWSAAVSRSLKWNA